MSICSWQNFIRSNGEQYALVYSLRLILLGSYWETNYFVGPPCTWITFQLRPLMECFWNPNIFKVRELEGWNGNDALLFRKLFKMGYLYGTSQNGILDHLCKRDGVEVNSALPTKPNWRNLDFQSDATVLDRKWALIEQLRNYRRHFSQLAAG